MTAGHGPLVTLSWWWHDSRRVARILRPRREMHARIDLIEAEVDLLNRKVGFLVKALEAALEHAGYPVPGDFGGQPEPAEDPRPAPVTQRDLDDAVASLIRQARQEFGRGGAR